MTDITVNAEDLSALLLRLRRVRGGLPATAQPAVVRFPGFTFSSYVADNETMVDAFERVLDDLEAAVEGNQAVLARYEADRVELLGLQGDLAAVRRVLGVTNVTKPEVV